MAAKGFPRSGLVRLKEVLKGHVEHGGVPGVVAAVSRGSTLHVEVLGRPAVGAPAALKRDAIFRITSMTKPMIAVATLCLVEECRLRLDDPVQRWLPELANRRVLTRVDAPLTETVPALRPITVRDLLTFRLGFGILMLPPGTYPIQRACDELALNQGMPQPQLPPPPDEWLRRFATLPLMHQPGERWLYSTGSDLLGVLIARVAGKPLESFLQERLFGPLGMKDTAFHVSAKQLPRFTASYWTAPATGALGVLDEAKGQWSKPVAFPSGAAGLVSTIDDCLAFARMLLNGGAHGSKRVLSRAMAETMLTDQITPAQKAISGPLPLSFESHGWGLGVEIATHRENVWEAVGSYGWNGGFGTSWRNDPHAGVITLLFTQRAFTTPVAPPVHVDFWTTVYRELVN